MKITKRQLRSFIRESLEDDPRMKRYNRPRKEPRQGELKRTQAIYDKIRKDDPEFASEWMHDKEAVTTTSTKDNDLSTDLIFALQDTWDQVRLDVGISNPTAEEKSDESMAMIQTYYPELTQRMAGKSNVEIDELLQQAFGGNF